MKRFVTLFFRNNKVVKIVDLIHENRDPKIRNPISERFFIFVCLFTYCMTKFEAELKLDS